MTGRLQFVNEAPPISQPTPEESSSRDALEAKLSADRPTVLRDILDQARKLLSGADEILTLAKRSGIAARSESLVLGDEGEMLRWFVYPSEALKQLNGESDACDFATEGYTNPLIPLTYAQDGNGLDNAPIDVEKLLEASNGVAANTPVSNAGAQPAPAAAQTKRATSSKYPLICSDNTCFIPRKPFIPNPATSASTFTQRFPEKK